MVANVIVSNFAFLGDPIYWAAAAAFLLLLFMGLIIFLIILAKKTHAILEFKAMMSGKRLVLFFDDSRTVDWRTRKPESGLIEDDDYGVFIINERGTYVDKKTRNIIIPFSTSLGIGAPVKDFKTTDDLIKILGDEKELNKIRVALANGDLIDEKFDALKESVNFSSLKSLANTLIPHNIAAKINMEIAKRMKSFGGVKGKDIIVWTLIALGCIALMALVLYLTIGGKGGGSTTVINSAANLAQNATVLPG
jgi:hypothetical protein